MPRDCHAGSTPTGHICVLIDACAVQALRAEPRKRAMQHRRARPVGVARRIETAQFDAAKGAPHIADGYGVLPD
ncbi:hypothetical protein [Paraburkholderia sp.]|uniref:hypothetical protein n=1 Tax=Paraburkholderia sp. TaxID=1926495 RepID=UPI003C75523B